MSWGHSVPKAPPPPKSALSKLAPLIILILLCIGAAYVGYHIYLSVQKISTQASTHLEKKNVVFTKDGMRVGLKEVNSERYIDKTQGILVKAWNLSTWPAYKSRLWNKPKDDGAKERKGYSSAAS